MCNAVDTFKQNRHGSTSAYTVSVTTSSVQVIPRNENRIALIIGGVPSSRITIKPNGPVTADQGILINAAVGPLVLTLESHGDMVKCLWHAIADSGTLNFNWVESTRHPADM